jgi:predicted transposase YdaD
MMDFGYEIVRLWERPVEALLASGLATLPLTPLCRFPEGMSLEDGARWAINQALERLEREATPELALRLITALFILSGMRLKRDVILALFQGVRAMHESDTYQMILEEGRVEGEIRGQQRILLHLGRKKLGEPDDLTRRALTSITDPDRLDRLSDRMWEAATWQDLLQTP